MIKAIFRLLRGQPGEERPIFLLLGMGFFMGVFIATYSISAESIFLNELGQEYLKLAFFVTGALGIMSTLSFVYVQKRTAFSKLVVNNAVLIVLFTATMLYLHWGFSYRFVPFVMFVMMGPITAIILLGFWGLFGRIFDRRQQKRIIGGIDTGQLFATILAYFSIPFIRLFVARDNYDLVLIAGISAIGMVAMSIVIVQNYNVDLATVTPGEIDDEREEVKFKDILTHPYLRLLSLFLVFSMGAARFIDFSFLSVAETMYPDERQLTNFLSFFNATAVIISFLIQSFVNDYIIEKYGLKVSLMVMPILLALLTIAAIFSGHLFGYEDKTELFIFFFLFVTVANLTTLSLKDALENPAFKIFFLPFESNIRFDIQTRIEGVVNELARFLAGALLIVLGLFSFFKLIHYSYLIIALCIVVVFIASKLFVQYRTALSEALTSRKADKKQRLKGNEHHSISVLKTEIGGYNPNKVISALKLLERIEPVLFEDILITRIKHRDKQVRIFVYHKIGELLLYRHFKKVEMAIKEEKDDEVRDVASRALIIIDEARKFEWADNGLKGLVRSHDVEERMLAARLLSVAKSAEYHGLATELTRDINPQVKRAALISIGKSQRPEYWSILIENLSSMAYGNTAEAALVASGDPALHMVDNAFHKVGQYLETMERVIQIIGRIGGKEANELLWKKIEFPDRKIVYKILLSLSYNGYRATELRFARIKIILESVIGDIAWNFNAIMNLKKSIELDDQIEAALEEENRANYDNLFMLLGMIYDPQSVQLVKENIDTGIADSTAFAIELMNIFVDDDLKAKIFPVLDNLKDNDRLAKLEQFYPQEQFSSYRELLVHIINRDYNRINKWTKSLAIYRLGFIESGSVDYNLSANLFNPDFLIRQTAAWVIYQLDQLEYEKVTRRLETHIKNDLDQYIKVLNRKISLDLGNLLLIERILLLKTVHPFGLISGRVLVEIAQNMEEVRAPAETTVIERGDDGNNPIFVVVEGGVKVHDEQETVEVIREGEVFGNRLVLSSEMNAYYYTTESDSIFLMLSKDDYYDFMSKHVEIIEAHLADRVVKNDQLESMEAFIRR